VQARLSRNSPDRLLVEAQAAVADIMPVAGDRQLLILPTLRFSLAIEPRCGATARVESILVSAADTRQIFSIDDIEEQPVIEATLSIPNRQLGPIRIGEFCRLTDMTAVKARELTVRGALTAHLALRCVRDEEPSTTYVSQPLDIIIRCNIADDAVPVGTSGNQEASAESEPRL
jgi:hypothetical protein